MAAGRRRAAPRWRGARSGSTERQRRIVSCRPWRAIRVEGARRRRVPPEPPADGADRRPAGRRGARRSRGRRGSPRARRCRCAGRCDRPGPAPAPCRARCRPGRRNSSARRSGSSSWRDRPKSISTAAPGAFAVAQHDVARLDVEVDDVLAVEVVQRRGDLGPDLRDADGRQRRLVHEGQQGAALDQLHHDVGLLGEVRGGDEARHVRPGEARAGSSPRPRSPRWRPVPRRRRGAAPS